MAITYSTNSSSLAHVYRTTTGGTVFSANLVSGAFDIFEDAPTVDDALYVGVSKRGMLSRILFDITTAMVGTDIVLKWEFYGLNPDGVTLEWRELPSQQDDTTGLTVLGAESFWAGLPYNPRPISVNGTGTSTYWIRCRLESFTAVTEGGRTDQIYGRKAYVTISGYSDVAPCTLEEIYQYMKTNYPHLTGITKIGGFENIPHNMATYDFREVHFNVVSRLLVKNEGFHQGLGYSYGSSGWGGYSYYYYLQLGEKVGDTLGTGTSWLIHHSASNSHPFEMNVNTRIYGSLIKGQGTGYIPDTGAEYCGNLLSEVNLLGSTSPSMKNNIIESSLWLLHGIPDPFTGNKMVFSPRLGFIYNDGFILRKLDYECNDTTSIMQFHNSTGFDPQWIFIDPIKPLPLNQAATPNIVYRGISTILFNWSQVWFHDVSAGTYADYTVEANDATSNNMPLHGDVGDCYYFGLDGTIGRFGLYLRMLADMSNDYEYVWEKYAGGVWVAASRVVENADNFSVDGDYYPFAGNNTTMAAVTINGINKIYGRLRIITKGSTTPMLTRLQYCSEGCIGDWKIQTKNTFSLTVRNEAGDLIQGANVIIKLDGGEIWNEDTGINGQITPQELLYVNHYFDPFGGGYQKISTDILDGYTLEISKAGFWLYESSIDISTTATWDISLIPLSDFLAAVPLEVEVGNPNITVTVDASPAVTVEVG